LIKKSFIDQEAIFSNVNNVRLISPSTWLKNVVNESKILSKLPITVIKNPVPQIFFDYPVVSNSNATTIKIAFIATSLDNPYKGFKVFVKAVNKVASIRSEEITVILIGKGGDAEFNSKVRVERNMAQNDLAMVKLLSTVDLLIVPSNQDNSPSVIGEALSMGITVLGSEIGGIPEILNEFNMPTFAVGEHDQLANKILELGQFKQKEEIRKQAKRYFSGEIIAGKLLEIYSQALI
jgi:glycosyltransferase involved in cell wall biosynthesis